MTTTITIPKKDFEIIKELVKGSLCKHSNYCSVADEIKKLLQNSEIQEIGLNDLKWYIEHYKDLAVSKQKTIDKLRVREEEDNNKKLLID